MVLTWKILWWICCISIAVIGAKIAPVTATNKEFIFLLVLLFVVTACGVFIAVHIGRAS